MLNNSRFVKGYSGSYDQDTKIDMSNVKKEKPIDENERAGYCDKYQMVHENHPLLKHSLNECRRLGLKVSYEYINFTGEVIYVGNRNGAVTRVPSLPKEAIKSVAAAEQIFIIRVRYTYGDDITWDGIDVGRESAKIVEGDELTNDFNDKVTDAKAGKRSRSYKERLAEPNNITQAVSFNLEDIKENDYAIYSHVFDVTISTNYSKVHVRRNPNSTRYVNVKEMQDDEFYHNGIDFLINDTNAELREAWIIVANKPFQCSITRDMDLPPGLYITHRNLISKKCDTYEIPMENLTLWNDPEAKYEFGKFIIYPSKKAAMSYGSKSAVMDSIRNGHEEERAKRDAELARMKSDLEEQKLQHDKERREFAMEKMKHEERMKEREAAMKAVEHLRQIELDEIKARNKRLEEELRTEHEFRMKKEEYESKKSATTSNAFVEVMKAIGGFFISLFGVITKIT